MKWNIFKKDKEQYDWVIKYLDDEQKFKAPPYLWTRIRAHIHSRQKTDAPVPELHWGEPDLINRLLPFFLTASIVLGIALGKIFSDRLQNQLDFIQPPSKEFTITGAETGYNPYQIIENNFDLPGLIEVNNGNN